MSTFYKLMNGRPYEGGRKYKCGELFICQIFNPGEVVWGIFQPHKNSFFQQLSYFLEL